MKKIKKYLSNKKNIIYIRKRTKYTLIATFIFSFVAFGYFQFSKSTSNLEQAFIDKNSTQITKLIDKIDINELIKSGLRDELINSNFTTSEKESLISETGIFLNKNQIANKLENFLLNLMSDKDFNVYLFGILYGVLYTFALYKIVVDKDLSSSIAYIGFFTANYGLFFSNGYINASFGYFIAAVMGTILVIVNEVIAKEIRDGKAISGGRKRMENYLSKNDIKEFSSIISEVMDNRKLSSEDLQLLIEQHSKNEDI
ncbi:MAG: hypothetical protein PHZ26_02710 [Candidatus Gracilibacteria bacterium]|nr:hypothetical protein [Candidatus Gracilibacteria bacterium]MDD2908644.1 hypothetical protein [Candidatus Gracilibacteria bacterium]